MNPVFLDPNLKVNMSLDEIIRLTKRQNNHYRGRRYRKMKKNPRNKGDMNGPVHSVPLVQTTNGVDISKESPLSNTVNKINGEAFKNPAPNPDLQQKLTEMIPDENNSKLVNPSHRAQKILGHAIKKKLTKPRKLKKNPNEENISNLLPDKPPPLVSAYIYKPVDETKMDVDNPDDDIVISDFQKQLLDLDLSNEILQAKKLCFSALRSNSQTRTLNDRFTMLYRSHQF